MPEFVFLCSCKRLFGRYISGDVSSAEAECLNCGNLVTSSLRMTPDPPKSYAVHSRQMNVDYACPITGKRVTSKLQHEENLKLHNCRVYEDGETQAGVKRRADEEAAFDRAIDETVEKTIDAWSSDKREQLAKELTHGVDAIVERK